MKFDFSYGGGVTGLKYRLDADSEDLDPVHKKSLEAIADLDTGKLKKTNPLAKDMLKYKLNIGEKDLTFTDDNIPAEYEPLIAHLREKAKLAL